MLASQQLAKMPEDKIELGTHSAMTEHDKKVAGSTEQLVV